MTGALDYYGFAVLFSEVHMYQHIVPLLKFLSFIQVAFMGDRRDFFNSFISGLVLAIFSLLHRNLLPESEKRTSTQMFLTQGTITE